MPDDCGCCGNSENPAADTSCGGSVTRRGFVGKIAAAAAASIVLPRFAMAGPFDRADFERLVPADKKLDPQWVKSLFERGSRTVCRGAELEKIGMPIGGICTGQVYLGGDGKLWHWDVFNQQIKTGPDHYEKPMDRDSPLDQGFAVKVTAGGVTQVRALDASGFSDITFCGEYPIGFVEYRADDLPVTVSLEAFPPFIPLNPDDSNLPVTIMRFTVKNIGSGDVTCEVGGWLENAICYESSRAWSGLRNNRILRRERCTFLECSAEAVPSPGERPPIVFADFEDADYGGWKVEGTAFGRAPAKGAPGASQKLRNFRGTALANSWASSDAPTGKLTSPRFVIERRYISFLIGGGNHPGQTCIDLLVEDKTVRTRTGQNSDEMEWVSWDVSELAGKTAQLRILDNHGGAWGHIDVDQIEFRDLPRTSEFKLDSEPDFGTIGLALLGPAGDDSASPSVSGSFPDDAFNGRPLVGAPPKSTRPFPQKMTGVLARRLQLAPGAQATVSFVLAWRFRNLALQSVKVSNGRRYATRFKSALAAAEHVAANIESLSTETRLWHDTWYDSTLPYWFLDRTFANTATLATSTCHWFNDGRFYGWEGVGCCSGTCTHVWHYAQSVARIFPQLERDLRERTDFGVAFDPETGLIRYRAERLGLAIDGQAGCILRCLREHLISPNDEFLKRNWTNIKKAVQCLIEQDRDGDGIVEGAQYNTLDSAWYGPVAWLSGLSLAAIRAAEQMAGEAGDERFAAQLRKIFERGARRIVELLWDKEYFINRPDPHHPESVNSGTGCEIDQVLGQSWAWQIGLGRVLPAEQTRTALKSLWKYNFTPDVGPFRSENRPGRWYAMPGEAGMLMCTFPRADWDFEKAKGAGKAAGTAGYFNECMSGFEYQVAGHMIREGMITEGLAVTRAIHDRYHASRRNPWNEVECGDHYARAMASYGVFLAACGFDYHGPKGHIGFAPAWKPADFRAPFTTAEGWGTWSQKVDGQTAKFLLALKWGALRLRTISVEGPGAVHEVDVRFNGKPLGASHREEGTRLTVALEAEAELNRGDMLEISVQ